MRLNPNNIELLRQDVRKRGIEDARLSRSSFLSHPEYQTDLAAEFQNEVILNVFPELADKGHLINDRR